MTSFTIIAAVSANNVIGIDGKLPWFLPSDLKHFKDTTLGRPMIMGRKTFDSFGGRPLPGRPHIILSKNFRPDPAHEDQVFVATTIKEAMDIAKSITSEEAFVIGGGNVYGQFLQHCDKMILSVVEHRVNTEAGEVVRFPLFHNGHWPIRRSWRVESDTYPYEVRVYSRER